jgi:hypothetical protein
LIVEVPDDEALNLSSSPGLQPRNGATLPVTAWWNHAPSINSCGEATDGQNDYSAFAKTNRPMFKLLRSISLGN